MSSSNTLKKKKGHQKNYNRPDVVPSGMLDAYVDNSSGVESVSLPKTKPVSTKNKNKKKLEARRMEEAAKEKEEEVTKAGPEEVVILDSWEDIDPDYVPPKASPVSAASKKETPKSQGKKKPVDQETQMALARLNETISKMSNLFVGKQEDTSPKEEKINPQTLPMDDNKISNPQTTQPPSNSSSDKPTTKTDDAPNKEKSKEEVKAEREAKKAAKAARRAGAKGEAAPSSQPTPPESKPPPPSSESKKSNAEIKAERRAKQEAQRAAKTVGASKAPPPTKEETNKNPPPNVTNNNNQSSTKTGILEKKPRKKCTAEVLPSKSSHRKVILFSHLPIYERSFSNSLPLVNGDIHPVIIQLGLQYSQGTISGSNARCVSLMHALKRVISDYVTPPQKELSRDLHGSLKPYISFLSSCRSLSVSMENALRYVRSRIVKLDHSMSDEEAKAQLMEDIDEFILVNIVLASKQISMTAREKIKDGDVILTYGHSSLVRSVFLYAAQSGVKFRVIVADSRPKFEGKEMIRHLVSANIKVTYVLISAVPYIIREVSKVIVGASSVLANGTVNSRVGTSQVALIAKASNVPVLVCCETYKFSERVQTDSFVFNELGDPNDLVSPGDPHEDWQNNPKLNLLNLSYDITPASLVDAIISEISVIPGTSVPVVLRLKNSENNIK